MYIPNDKMKYNRFQVVAIPSPAVYFQKVGQKLPSSNMYSPEELIAVNGESKLAEIHRMMNEMAENVRVWREQQEAEASKESE